MLFVTVKFETKALKSYIYTSPVIVHRGDIVLINVFGEIKAATVESTSQIGPLYQNKPIRSIMGIGWRLEELETIAAHQPDPPLKTGLQFIANLL